MSNVEIKFSGDTLEEVQNQMFMFLMQTNYPVLADMYDTGTDKPDAPEDYREPSQDEIENAPDETPDPEDDPHNNIPEQEEEPEPKPKPKRKPRKTTAKKPKPEPEEPELSDEDAKKAAIDLLMEMYNGSQADDVKALLKEFKVKKFGEISDEDGPKLLERAKEVKE
jgi:outer membrane biosynthesis protein TonB